MKQNGEITHSRMTAKKIIKEHHEPVNDLARASVDIMNNEGIRLCVSNNYIIQMHCK